MKYLDDILCLFGILCIVIAAFGVDWRLGMLMLGVGVIAIGICVGRFFRANPGMLQVMALRREEKRKKRQAGRSDGE